MPLLDLAARHTADAASGVVRCRSQSATEHARLEQLGSYLADYDTHSARASRWQLVNRAAFLANIHTAIEQQRQAVDRAHEAVDRAVEDWNRLRTEQRRYETLLARERRRRSVLAAHREQRTLDDVSTRHLRPDP
ncbi:MAG: flagellar export protein FliJ [Rhodanobacteraceae bacterium]